jgi:type IV pilus assembly protein PilM
MFEPLTLKSVAAGVDLTDFYLRIVKLKRQGHDFDLASFNEQPIPAGLIEGGEIKNETELVKVIRQAVTKIKGEKLKTDKVIISLPEEKCFLRIIQFPKMAAEELAKAIPFEAENHIPLPLKELYLDFEVIEPLVDHLDHFDILLVASPQKIIDSYLRVFKAAGLVPLAFESGSLAISRALVKHEMTTEPILLVNFDTYRTNLVIFAGRSVRFTSSLQVCSKNLIEALVEGLSVTVKEAERIKKEVGIGAQTGARLIEKTGDSEFEREIINDERISNVLAPALSPLVTEIKDFLDFYYSHTSHEHLLLARQEVKRVLLSGDGAHLKGLTHFLAKELGISVALANPWVNILSDPENRVPEAYLQRSLSYATALGSALRGAFDEDQF